MAEYHQYDDIRLIISIDGGGNKYTDVLEVSMSFEWKYGEKEIIAYPENIGLRKHVIACGNLTEKFDSIIVLEEDCFVSRNYYNYACKSLNFYSSEPMIAGISLYAYTYYESAGMPFMPVIDGFDTYFMQVPGSLGQVWTKTHWRGFMDYYHSNHQIEKNDKIPEKVKTWPETSWKKYFYKYMVEKNLYFVYPQVAFSTNFGDVGTHLTFQTQVYQVALENYKVKEYNFAKFEDSKNKYDAYFEMLPECLISHKVNIDLDTCIDLMGSKPLELFKQQYCLSIKKCLNPIQCYDNSLIPIIQNVIYGVDGKWISYAESYSFGELFESARIQQIVNAQSLGFSTGEIKILSGKTYKIGDYILNPHKIWGFFKRKIE
jgi:hypothetical protein